MDGLWLVAMPVAEKVRERDASPPVQQEDSK